MKKSIAMCMALLMMSQTAFAAVTCTENPDTKAITVTGPINGANKTGIVSFEMKNQADEIVHQTFISTDDEGNFSYTFKLPINAATGRYNLTFNTYGLETPETAVLDHECEQDVISIISALNGAADVSAVKVILNNNKSKLNIAKWYEIIGDPAKTAAAQAVLDGRGAGYQNSAMPTIKQEILSNIANDAFKSVTNEADMNDAIETFGEMLDLAGTAEYYDDYQELSAENAKTAREIMAANADNIETVASIFDVGVVLVEIANAKQPGDIKKLIDDNTSYLTTTAQTAYINSDKAATALYLTSYFTKNSLRSMSELSLAIVNAYYEQNKFEEPSKEPSKGGSSSGGGNKVVNPGTPIATVPPTTPETTPVFNDLGDAMWAEKAINSLVDRKIISGMGDGRFEPMSKLTREQFATIIVNAFGMMDENAEADFSDIPKNHWAYKAVASAYAKGIINGLDENTFGAQQPIKRCDIAVMVTRAVKAAGLSFTENGEVSLTDIDNLPEYAKESVVTLVKSAIINGFDEDNTFRGNETATRAQAAQIIYNLLEEVK